MELACGRHLEWVSERQLRDEYGAENAVQQGGASLISLSVWSYSFQRRRRWATFSTVRCLHSVHEVCITREAEPTCNRPTTAVDAVRLHRAPGTVQPSSHQERAEEEVPRPSTECGFAAVCIRTALEPREHLPGSTWRQKWMKLHSFADRSNLLDPVSADPRAQDYTLDVVYHRLATHEDHDKTLKKKVQ